MMMMMNTMRRRGSDKKQQREDRIHMYRILSRSSSYLRALVSTLASNMRTCLYCFPPEKCIHPHWIWISGREHPRKTETSSVDVTAPYTKMVTIDKWDSIFWHPLAPSHSYSYLVSAISPFVAFVRRCCCGGSGECVRTHMCRDLCNRDS